MVPNAGIKVTLNQNCTNFKKINFLKFKKKLQSCFTLDCKFQLFFKPLSGTVLAVERPCPLVPYRMWRRLQLTSRLSFYPRSTLLVAQGQVPELKQWQAIWAKRVSSRKPQAEFVPCDSPWERHCFNSGTLPCIEGSRYRVIHCIKESAELWEEPKIKKENFSLFHIGKTNTGSESFAKDFPWIWMVLTETSQFFRSGLFVYLSVWQLFSFQFVPLSGKYES